MGYPIKLTMTERQNKPRLLLLLLFSFCFSFGYAQNKFAPKENTKKNLVSLGLATNMIWGSGGLAYERQLHSGFINPFVRGKYEFCYFTGMVDFYGFFHEWSAMLGAYTGRNTHHFEMALGARTDNGFKYRPRFGILTADLGYRYAKPGARFSGMAGISWPNGLYLRTGFRF